MLDLMDPSRGMRLSKDIIALLRCPVCHSHLRCEDDGFTCLAATGCGLRFPTVDGVPVLINDANSLFSIDDFVHGRPTTYRAGRPATPIRRLGRLLLGHLPELGRSRYSAGNYERFGRLLLEGSDHPRVLVVGARVVGEGMHRLEAEGRLDLVEADIAFGPRTSLVCDAHDLPFEAGSFDGVVVQAVLEHVVDPFRCVQEIHRVLRAGASCTPRRPSCSRCTVGHTTSCASLASVIGAFSDISRRLPQAPAAAPPSFWRGPGSTLSQVLRGAALSSGR